MAETDLPIWLAGRIGFTPMPGSRSFEPVTFGRAVDILGTLAGSGMAYGPIQAKPEDRLAVEQVLSALKPGLRLFSNGNLFDLPGEQPNRGWTPLTNSTFDTGIAGYNGEIAFIYWATDED